MTQAVNLTVRPELTINNVQEVVICRTKNSVRILCFRSANFFYVLCIPITAEITNTRTERRTSTARN